MAAVSSGISLFKSDLTFELVGEWSSIQVVAERCHEFNEQFPARPNAKPNNLYQLLTIQSQFHCTAIC